MSNLEDVPIRDASTVVLLRDGDTGLDVWLLTRVKGMAFAGGMTVFPGGRADESDVDLPFLPGAEVATATRFGCDEARARMLVGAAIRETFEETGVLLANPTVDLSAARGDVEAGRVSFGELLRANGVTVDAAALHPWSRWITPIGEVRRYDTHFFIGVLPEGADAADVTSESSRAEWLPAAEALRQAKAGERGLLPPTLATLTSLLPFNTVAEVVAAANARDLEPISPTISVVDGNLHAELADGTVFVIPLSSLR